MIEKRGFTLKEASIYTAIGARTLRRLVEEGRIAFAKCGTGDFKKQSIIFLREDLDRLLTKNRIEGARV